MAWGPQAAVKPPGSQNLSVQWLLFLYGHGKEYRYLYVNLRSAGECNISAGVYALAYDVETTILTCFGPQETTRQVIASHVCDRSSAGEEQVE